MTQVKIKIDNNIYLFYLIDMIEVYMYPVIQY